MTKVHRYDVVVIEKGGTSFVCVVLAIHGSMLTVAILNRCNTAAFTVPKWAFCWYERGFSFEEYYVQTVSSFDMVRVSCIVGKVKPDKMHYIFVDVMHLLSKGESLSDWLETLNQFNASTETDTLYTPVSMTVGESQLKGMSVMYDFGYDALASEEQKCRPAIVLQEVGEKCIVAPVTHRTDTIPFHIQIKPEDGFAFHGLDALNGSVMLEHVRTIKKKDIILCTGLMNSSLRNRINRELYFNSIKGIGYPFYEDTTKYLTRYLKKRA